MLRRDAFDEDMKEEADEIIAVKDLGLQR